MKRPGLTLSIALHLALILWLVVGWGFDSEPLPFEVTPISVVSGEEYAALTTATTPDPVAQTPTEAQPTVEPAATPEPAPEQSAPPPETTPEVPPETPPAPEPPPAAAPDLPPAETPAPQEAPRVAAVPVETPPPDAAPAETPAEAASPDAAPDAPVAQTESAPAAPEAATTQIVTEATRPAGALDTSVRPQARPTPPAPQATPAPTPVAEPEPDNAAVDDAVAAALAAATAAASTPAPTATRQGPPMSGAEVDGFRVAVSACWNVDVGSEAANVTIVVAFGLTQSGHVDGDTRLVSGSGGSQAAIDTAYAAARRAILRCQSQGRDGYDLPPEKYETWREMELTFDPSGMRLR